MKSDKITDPIEKVVAQALETAGIDFLHEKEMHFSKIDFFLPDFAVSIECKHSYTPRADEQLQKTQNIILIQGMKAAKAFHVLLNGNI